jgi:acyl-CoA oxidase
LNQENLILEGMRAGRVIVNDGIDNGHQIFRECTQEWILANSNPLGLTGALFTPMLKLQGTAEQLAYWLPLSESGKIVGSYTQTEVGHGTFVGGIQTTATFDKKTDEFVIHTPSVSAIKHWPGALGFASTHTITMAQLIIDGKTKGPHSFVMQIRSTDDFKPLPGVELGDIG